jgi:hypothetical protein
MTTSFKWKCITPSASKGRSSVILSVANFSLPSHSRHLINADARSFFTFAYAIYDRTAGMFTLGITSSLFFLLM